MRPSSFERDVFWFVMPASYKHEMRNSELLSPVKTRPVLFPPEAAGASPTIIILPFISPYPVSGFLQNISRSYFFDFSRTCSLKSTSLGHFLQLIIFMLRADIESSSMERHSFLTKNKHHQQDTILIIK